MRSKTRTRPTAFVHREDGEPEVANVRDRLRGTKVGALKSGSKSAGGLEDKGCTREREKAVNGDNGFGSTLSSRGLTHTSKGGLRQWAVRVRVVYYMQRLGEILSRSAWRSDFIAELAGRSGTRCPVEADASAEYPDVIDSIARLLADAIELPDSTAV
jgi:hypothetical protein